MTSADLKYAIAAYYRYARQCLLVCFERGPYGGGIPDVLAVTPELYLHEIECKISLSDFKADAKKFKWTPHQLKYVEARTFYYAVPRDLVDVVRPHLREGSGLLVVHDTRGARDSVYCDVKAKPSKTRLTQKAFMNMVRHQTGSLLGLSRENTGLRQKLGLNKKETQ